MGRPILTAGEEAVASAKAKVRQTVDDIQAIPMKVQKRLDQTKEEIIQSLEAKKRDVLSIPSRLQQRVEQAKDKAIQSLEEEKQNLLLKVDRSLMYCITIVLMAITFSCSGIRSRKRLMMLKRI